MITVPLALFIVMAAVTGLVVFLALVGAGFWVANWYRNNTWYENAYNEMSNKYYQRGSQIHDLTDEVEHLREQLEEVQEADRARKKQEEYAGRRAMERAMNDSAAEKVKADLLVKGHQARAEEAARKLREAQEQGETPDTVQEVIAAPGDVCCGGIGGCGGVGGCCGAAKLDWFPPQQNSTTGSASVTYKGPELKSTQ